MKHIFLVILTLSITFNILADDKYDKAMKKNISKIDTAKTVEGYLEIINSFERIAFAEKDKWLPYYYSAMLYILTSFVEVDNNKKDSFLDNAEKHLKIADSLQQNESEILTLKGLLAQARMQIDPMSRWAKFGPEADRNFKKAIELDSLNPRPEYLIGVGLYYTPEQFGGGPKTAKQLLENSLRKFNSFIPINEIMPKWGKQNVEALLEQINNK